MKVDKITLVGMFDSPYVRRVAVSMEQLGVDFDYLNWSVGKDQAQLRTINPLGRVPVISASQSCTARRGAPAAGSRRRSGPACSSR